MSGKDWIEGYVNAGGYYMVAYLLAAPMLFLAFVAWSKITEWLDERAQK